MRVLTYAKYAVAIVGSLALPALAGEVVTYSYDAQGHLLQGSYAGDGFNNGLKIQYTVDNSSNINSKNITGSKNSSNKIIIIPLNGYTLIQIKDQ